MAYCGQGYRHQNVCNGRNISPVNRTIPIIPHQAPIPVRPNVQFKYSPFYDVLGDIMMPHGFGVLPFTTETTMFRFHFTPQQAQDFMSVDFAKHECTLQVHVRLCVFGQRNIKPFRILMKVNNKLPPLNLIPEQPVDITRLCQLKITAINHITVSCSTSSFSMFSISIYLVKKPSYEIVLQRLKTSGNCHSDHTKALIKEKFAQDPDGEIVTTGLMVSLLCPLSKTRMLIPCRACTCSHLQCFDASTFLMLNERNPTWVCPVCDQSCTYDKLIIDGYLIEILQEALCYTDICFHEDCSWSVVKPQKKNTSQHVIPLPDGSSPSSALFVPPSPSIGKDSIIKEMNSLIIVSDDESD